MITGEYWKLQDDDALGKIDAAAVRLLSSGGVRIEHEEMLDLLEGSGCRVDRSGRRCFFPEKLIRDATARIGGQTWEKVELPAGWSPQTRLSHGGSYPHLLEWPSGRRRLATRQDVTDMAKMAHTLPEFGIVGKVLTCSEIDQRVEPLWNALQLAQITDKPIGGGEVFYANNVGPLVQMGEILTGKPNDASLVPACDFFISPLILDGNQAECFLAKRRFGIINAPGTMPISGISAPVTIAGTVTVAVAELMAGWIMGYAVNPELPIWGIVSSGSLDMRTLAACFGSPEAMLQDATVVSLCRRLYGINVSAATGYVDCKRPGIEATFQKMLPLVGAPVGTALHPGWDGLLSAGQDYSPVQHILDTEIMEAVKRFWCNFEVNEETIGLELIESMLTNGQTNFLDTDHTLAHYKAEQWYPRWFDRSLWQGDAAEADAERKMLTRIDHYCKDAIERYKQPEIDTAKVAELRRVFLAAEHETLGTNVTCM